MPELTMDQLTLGLTIAAGVALLSFLVAVFCVFRLRKARREYAVLRGDNGDRDILSAVGRAMKSVDTMNQRIDGLAAAQEEQGALSRFALQRFSLVRYDAFEDMGGRLSFSAALLDDHGDGIVFTSINGRTETRTYAKPITRLSSSHNLSDEERAAIEGAAAGQGRGETPAAAASR